MANTAWEWADIYTTWGLPANPNAPKQIDNAPGTNQVINQITNQITPGTDARQLTSKNIIGTRKVISAGKPEQVVSGNFATIRVSVRNVGNNSCIFSEDASINPTQYSSALQGVAVGNEPTAGESATWTYNGDLFAYSVLGTVLLVEVESV